jgi:hypothetical protein
MDKLKKHGDELDFFARELQSRRVFLGFWKGLPIAVYGFLSDYGRSYVQPPVLLAATMVVGSFLFAAYLIGFWTPLLSPGGRRAIGIGTVSFRACSRSNSRLQSFPIKQFPGYRVRWLPGACSESAVWRRERVGECESEGHCLSQLPPAARCARADTGLGSKILVAP